MPAPLYYAAYGYGEKHKRFEKILREKPDWKEFVQCGYFTDLTDKLMAMDIEKYKKIWQFANKEENFLDAFLHLKRSFKIEGIDEKYDKAKLRRWSLTEFKSWANNFIEAKKKNDFFPIFLNDLSGLEGFYEGF